MGLVSNILTKISAMFTKARSFSMFSKGYTSSGSLRDNAVVGMIADRIATNVGKLQPQVLRKNETGTTILDNPLSKLLSLRPSPETSTYDWLYKMACDLIYTSNAFAIIFYNRDFTNIERIQPITVRGGFLIFEDEKGNMYMRFTWDYDGQQYTVPYQFVIHLKARYNRRRFAGTPPDIQLQSSIELLDTTYDGIRNAVKNSASLRGYLKYGNVTKEEKLQEKVREFTNAYMRAENEGGIAGLDSTIEFKELQSKPVTVPTASIQLFRKNLLDYYGMSEKVLSSEYDETSFNAFYEAVVEPIALQLSLEFTFKVFTERERAHGNKVIFVANRIQYATLATRMSMIEKLFDRSLITVNEARELVYMPAVEDGDVRMISLNYVKSENQDQYQIGKDTVPLVELPEEDETTASIIEEAKQIRAELQAMKGGE